MRAVANSNRFAWMVWCCLAGIMNIFFHVSSSSVLECDPLFSPSPTSHFGVAAISNSKIYKQRHCVCSSAGNKMFLIATKTIKCIMRIASSRLPHFSASSSSYLDASTRHASTRCMAYRMRLQNNALRRCQQFVAPRLTVYQSMWKNRTHRSAPNASGYFCGNLEQHRNSILYVRARAQ